MKNKNMINREILTSHCVNTQYNDLRGSIAIDFHDMGFFLKMCDDYCPDIDLKKYIPVGFRMFEDTLDGIGEDDKVSASILFAKLEDLDNNIEPLNIVKKSFTLKYTELNRYIKRYDFLALSNRIKTKFIETKN